MVSVESAGPFKQHEALLAAVREAVQSKYRFLQIFANVLCNTGNTQLGKAILRDYREFMIST